MSSERRRTHPADVVLQTLTALRGLLVPFLIGLVLSSGSGRPGAALMFGAVGVVISTFVGYVRWQATTYAVDGAALSFRSGVFSPDETIVPIARISAVDTVSGPVQRLFGVVELQVQVAGRAKPEVTLRAVDEAESARLRAALGHPSEARREPAWRLRPRDALIGALTAPQIGVLVPVLGAVGVVAQDAVNTDNAGGLLDRAPDTAGEIALAVALLVVAAWLVSIAGALVIYGGFEVETDGERVRIRRGLVRRRTATVPLDRIQALRLVEGPLRQPFGLLAVRMEVAGYGTDAGASGTLLPVVRRGEATGVLTRIVPALADAGAALRRPPRRALRRYVLRPAAAGVAAGAALTLAVPGAWPGALALVAVGLAIGALAYRDAGWALRERRLVLRRRRLGRTTLVARAGRLQDLHLSRTLLQRRARLAGFGVRVGTGAKGAVAHLDDPDAEDLFAALSPARAGIGQPAAR
jgi:putative membrane protein